MDKKLLDTGMYIIDKNYRIVNYNDAVKHMYPEIQEGQLCYKNIALKDNPCQICPLNSDSIVLFYSPSRKEWISANAATMHFAGEECYAIQFRRRVGIGGKTNEIIQLEAISDHISELQSPTGNACVIGAYYEPGSPVFYANEHMVEMLGYDSLNEFVEAIDGMVVNLVHPDDRPRVKCDTTGIETPGSTFETTYRMPRKDGSWFWAVTRGKTIKTDTGRIATLSVCMDMSDLLGRHETLQAEKRELENRKVITEAMMDNMPSGYHRCKAEEGCPFLYIGNHFEDIVGFTKQEIETEFDNKYRNLVWHEDVAVMKTYEEMRAMQGQGNSYDTSVYRMKHKDGGYRWVTDSTMFVDLGEDSFFQSTIADITEYIENLEKAKQIAEASSLAKSTFLFNASHDIRTPMNAITGFAHIIEENADNEKIVKKTVGKIKQSGSTLMTLLNDVLELARIEKGKDDVNPQPLKLCRFTEQLHEMFLSEMEAQGLTFCVENDIKHAHVMADELKLTRIGMNLLSNAKKFTPTGGQVVFGVEELTSDTQKASYRLYVRDTGIGMSEEFQMRAFEQFERERSSTESGITGSGLGLAIIKRLVDLMGGSCRIQSVLGKGSEFSVFLTLPFADANKRSIGEMKSDTSDFSGKRVLLVEDNDFNREIARYMLESLHFSVDEAENGSECVNKLLKEPVDYYDLVLMDIQMPVMDGYVATEKIRNMKEAKLAAIPIVAMTANAFDEDKQRCFEVGMNGHIGKPIDSDILAHELTKLFKVVSNDENEEKN